MVIVHLYWCGEPVGEKDATCFFWSEPQRRRAAWLPGWGQPNIIFNAKLVVQKFIILFLMNSNLNLDVSCLK